MKTSQNKEILNHLKTHTGITSMQAFDSYGITRISARIYDLRLAGYEIESVFRSGKNRRGKRVNFTEYRLKGKKK